MQKLKITKEIIQGAKIELARRDFFSFCNLLAPDFYQKERTYLVELSNGLQEFLHDNTEVMIVNEPPRHGKSRTASNFEAWAFGIDSKLKIMTGTYNETLSTTFSKAVRNMIAEEKADKDVVVYSDIFPNTKIKYGDGAMNLWSLAGGYNNYLATSPGGTATGFGANILVIDDLIKNAEEANNERVLESHWEWFTNTMLSRLESGGKILVIMTRWHSNDLSGKILEWCKEKKKRYKHLSMKALQDDGAMLCDEILSKEAYEDKVSAMGADIASANYQQLPIDIRGRLYDEFKTYDHLPTDSNGNSLIEGIYSYTDTADEGSDYLVTFIWAMYQHQAYILDVVNTQAPMEETEPLVASRLYENKVMRARIESNNGGKGFARNVLLILENEFECYTCDVTWFHQSKNKKSRILTNATTVQRIIYFPSNWRDKWSELYSQLFAYQREGKNKHDDQADALTGVVETIIQGGL
ncbi:MAG: phage terminase large subunit [Breznakia sp.]